MNMYALLYIGVFGATIIAFIKVRQENIEAEAKLKEELEQESREKSEDL